MWGEAESNLTINCLRQIIQNVVVNLVPETRLGGGGYVSFLVDANLVLEIRPVCYALGLRHFEPDIVRHGKLAMEMDGMIQHGAPVMGLALHAEAFRQTRDLHTASDAADIVDDES